MASSGTYALNPDIGDFISEAFERCGIDPATLGARHTKSARMSLNLLFSEWASLGSHLFAVDEQTQTVTDGIASYTAAAGTLVILDAVIRRDGIDTGLDRISREAYHAIPDKTAEGMPSQIYHDRKAGTYYLWQTPENSTDVLRYNRLRRIQDISTSAETADVPYQWFEALASGLAAKLALKFAPDRVTSLDGFASRSFLIAKREDRERADTGFSLA